MKKLLLSLLLLSHFAYAADETCANTGMQTITEAMKLKSSNITLSFTSDLVNVAQVCQDAILAEAKKQQYTVNIQATSPKDRLFGFFLVTVEKPKE